MPKAKPYTDKQRIADLTQANADLGTDLLRIMKQRDEVCEQRDEAYEGRDLLLRVVLKEAEYAADLDVRLERMGRRFVTGCQLIANLRHENRALIDRLEQLCRPWYRKLEDWVWAQWDGLS